MAAYEALRAAGVEALFDDRDAQAGVKLADADLIGAPLRVTFGRRAERAGIVELRERRSGRVHEVAAESIVPAVLRVRGELLS